MKLLPSQWNDVFTLIAETGLAFSPTARGDHWAEFSRGDSVAVERKNTVAWDYRQRAVDRATRGE